MKRLVYTGKSFFVGAAIVCAVATFQFIMVLGQPLGLENYIIPFWVGGGIGLLIGFWQLRLRLYAEKLEE